MSISNFIFTACVACKNPVWNRQKLKNQVKKSISWTRDFKNQIQIDALFLASTAADALTNENSASTSENATPTTSGM